MSTLRGRAVRRGMMVTQDGAAPRVEQADAGQNLLRPSFRWSGGTSMPGAGGASPHGAFLDLSQVSSWRTIYAAASLAYIVGFHASLGRLNVRVGASPTSRGVAQLALVASYLIVLHYAVDTVAGGFPNVTALRAFQQAITQ